MMKKLDDALKEKPVGIGEVSLCGLEWLLHQDQNRDAVQERIRRLILKRWEGLRGRRVIGSETPGAGSGVRKKPD
jgi:hypothetical protein